jgi:hypothetical protein
MGERCVVHPARRCRHDVRPAGHPPPPPARREVVHARPEERRVRRARQPASARHVGRRPASAPGDARSNGEPAPRGGRRVAALHRTSHRRGGHRRCVRLRRIRRDHERRCRPGRPCGHGAGLRHVVGDHRDQEGDLERADAPRHGTAPARGERPRIICCDRRCHVLRRVRGHGRLVGAPPGRWDSCRRGWLGRCHERVRRGCRRDGTAGRPEH